jgi:tight adherence protein C
MVDVLVPVLAAALVFAAIVWSGVLVMRYRDSSAKRRSLAFVASYASSDPHAAIQKARNDESLMHKLALGLGNRIVSSSARRRIERQVIYCGRSEPGAADDVVIRKLMFLIVGLALGWLQAVALGGLWWLAPLVLGIFGYFVPDILLYNQGIKRDEEMGKGLPDALDMLNLCVESGLSFQAALSQVAINQDGPVADEFALTLQEMQYGRSRGQALEALAVRARQPDIQRFVSAMLQVDKMGVPVATVLREQAKEMRAKRYARAREMAQKVPVKILMPLMLCFLPALFVIILGPAVYGIVQVFSNT